jgi:RNA polymerase sigma-70 factor (ECF subfamily)
MGEVCACFNRLLPALHSGYGDLIRRIDLGGEDPAAVAKSLDITYGNLMVRLHRSRQALRKSLEHSCGACATHGCLDCSCGHGEAGPHKHG